MQQWARVGWGGVVPLNVQTLLMLGWGGGADVPSTLRTHLIQVDATVGWAIGGVTYFPNSRSPKCPNPFRP